MAAMNRSLEVLNSSGHLTLTWNPDKPDEVTEARKMVEKLRAEGYAFFVVAGSTGSDPVEQGNGMILVRRVEDPTNEEALPPEPGEEQTTPPTPIATVCQGTTQTGAPCGRKPTSGTPYCPWHQAGRKLKGESKPAAPQPTRRHVAVRRMAGG
jgi:hypothetical protein